MSFPYKVTVVGKDKDLHVTVDPQPVVTDEKWIPVVAKTFNAILTQRWDSIFGKGKLRAAILRELKKFHELGIIKPKEDE